MPKIRELCILTTIIKFHYENISNSSQYIGLMHLLIHVEIYDPEITRNMAVKNLLKTDSIDSLIYKETKGEFRGYRRDLLTEETPDNIKKIIFCCQCGGISRKPRVNDGKTFCTPCSPVKHTIVDSRVDEIVLQLKSRCPLSTRGCDWLGQLGDIEQHIRVCEKLRIDCEIGCGEVLERWETDEHLRKYPLRRERCEICGEEVEASKANRHIALCPRNPDGEVLCPYKELGCDVLRIQRKNLDTHLADNSIGHQKLLLKEIHQLRSENDKLSNVTGRMECDNSKQFQYLKGRDVIVRKRVWMLLAVAVLCIAMLVSFLHTERDRIHVNEHSIQSYNQSIQSVEESIQSNKQSIESNKQSIQSHEQSIQSHDQSFRFLMSNSYLHDYILDRDKTLQGVEWTHRNVRGETYYGPIFYLGNCKLRLHVYVYLSVSDDRRDAYYYVTRLKGDYDDVSDTCHITYIHLYSVNERYFSWYNVESISVSKKLKVGDEYYINSSFFIYEDITLSTRTIRIYFDFE